MGNINVLICLNIQSVLNPSNLNFWDATSMKSALTNPRLCWPLTFLTPPPPSTALTSVEQTAQKPQAQSACNEACSNMWGGLAESLIPQEARDRMSAGSGKSWIQKVERRLPWRNRDAFILPCVGNICQGCVVSPRPKSILIQGYSVSNLLVKMKLENNDLLILS